MQLDLDLNSILGGRKETVVRPVIGKLIPYQIYAFDRDREVWVASYTEARSKEEMVEKAKAWCPDRIAHCGRLIRLRESQVIMGYPHEPEGIPL